MTWAEAGELVKVLGAVATACAAWFAASIAYKGLEKWRSETTGKRRADLAANVLAATYQMEEVLRQAREPFVMVHEMVERPGVPDHLATNADYAPEARLLEHQEFFARFRTLRHEYAAVFGREAAKAIDALWRVRLDINHAVFFMIQNKELKREGDEEDKKLWKEQYYTAFRHHKEDEDVVLKRIKDAVAEVEAACRPAVEARDKGK
ncbi:MAG: hypothetical protein IT536_15365 [Hyphomicrobiales bacterium]|nr:hypothetical protein [Hyphomicrobiales bacterium]